MDSGSAMASNPRSLTKAVVALVGAMLALVFIFLVPPGETAPYPRCTFHMLTGGFCPGCGTLRCVHALLHGHIAQAAAYNVLTLLAIPFFAVWGANELCARAGGRPFIRRRLPAWAIWAIVVIIVAFWLLRNLPVYPFSLLAPHEL